MSQFQQLYNMQADAAAPNYDIDVIESFRNSRWNQSLYNNPYFFFGRAYLLNSCFMLLQRLTADYSIHRLRCQRSGKLLHLPLHGQQER